MSEDSIADMCIHALEHRVSELEATVESLIPCRLEDLKDKAELIKLRDDDWILFDECMPPNGSKVDIMATDARKRGLPKPEDMPSNFFVPPTHWKFPKKNTKQTLVP